MGEFSIALGCRIGTLKFYDALQPHLVIRGVSDDSSWPGETYPQSTAPPGLTNQTPLGLYIGIF